MDELGEHLIGQWKRGLHLTSQQGVRRRFWVWRRVVRHGHWGQLKVLASHHMPDYYSKVSREIYGD